MHTIFNFGSYHKFDTFQQAAARNVLKNPTQGCRSIPQFHKVTYHMEFQLELRMGTASGWPLQFGFGCPQKLAMQRLRRGAEFACRMCMQMNRYL